MITLYQGRFQALFVFQIEFEKGKGLFSRKVQKYQQGVWGSQAIQNRYKTIKKKIKHKVQALSLINEKLKLT